MGGVKLQGFPSGWLFPKVALNGAIVSWYMGSQRDQIPALKLFQSCHFAHIPRGQERFRDLRNLQKSVEAAAQIKGMWKDDGRWSEQSLEIYI